MEKYCFSYDIGVTNVQKIINWSIWLLLNDMHKFLFGPFYVCVLDIIWKISPPSSLGNTFIITVIDYFKKFVEAVPLHLMNVEVICWFILEHVIANFGIPSILLSENGMSFKNNEVKKFFEIFNIQHHFLTPYYPHSNGLANSNKNLEKILKKIVNKKKKWFGKKNKNMNCGQ
jgi:hypothetical protein